eukprot:gene4949-34725_t
MHMRSSSTATGAPSRQSRQSAGAVTRPSTRSAVRLGSTHNAPSKARTIPSRGQNTACKVVTEKMSPGLATSTLNKPLGTAKPRVVVLGSGWASISFIKSLPKDISDKYEVILVSPRNYFLYTPLLPAVATGTMEERSIVEPVRNLIGKKAKFFEALCKDINPEKKEMVCCYPADNGIATSCFKLEYDVLVMAVGCVNNTFGIKGVDEHCFYFKSIEDANKLRSRLSECFERASLPDTSEEIRVVELMDHVLSTYDRQISKYTAGVFGRAGIELVLNSRVASVGDGFVNVVNKVDNTEESIPFGACVWATGIAMNPLLKLVQERIPEQNHFRSLLTNEFLQMKGSNGSIYVLGDASTIEQPKAVDYAEQLFDAADVNNDNQLSLEELMDLLDKASTRFVHLKEHAAYLRSKNRGSKNLLNLITARNDKPDSSPFESFSEDTLLDKKQFSELLKSVEQGLRALPATAQKQLHFVGKGAELLESVEQGLRALPANAQGLRALPASTQVAKQQGDYVAALFANNTITGTPETTIIEGAKPFAYGHK